MSWGLRYRQNRDFVFVDVLHKGLGRPLAEKASHSKAISLELQDT